MNRTKPPKKHKLFNVKMQANLLLVFCVILAVTVALCFRLVYISKVNGQTYKQKVLEQQREVASVIPYQRGSISDRNGVVLAKSEKVYNVIFDPFVTLTYPIYVTETKKALSEVFGYAEEDIQEILDTYPDSKYHVLRKQVPVAKVQEFEALQANNSKIKGVWFEEEYVRTYPYETLASHVLGYTNKGDSGTWGVEQFYNSVLNGTNGRVYGFYDAELNIKRTVRPPENGDSLILTIDANIQTIAERYIKEFKKNVGCKNMGILVMNPNNGEILAMASNEGYNLNEPRDLSAWYTEEELNEMTSEEQYEKLNGIWRNFCISDTYEPGSTYKPFTVACGLEEHFVTCNQEFTCKGFETKGGWDIYCGKRSGHGVLNLTQVIMRSCNCALMNIVEDIGRERYHYYQVNYGFGNKTGIDLPGETSGIIMPEEKLNVTELATASFGQSFNVSMIQLAAGFSSLVNGGTLYQPHVVSAVVNSSGSVIEEKKPAVVRRTVTAQTSEFLREALYQTVEGGTATNAKVQGYLVGGKTGTAQKLPRADKKYVVSFISCVPCDHPEVVTYIVIDEPEDEEYFDSSYYATTTTSAFLKEILPFFGIYPEGDIEYRVDFPQSTEEDIGDEISTDSIPEL